MACDLRSRKMQDIGNKGSDDCSVHSKSTCINSLPSWWNSSTSAILQPSYSKGWNLSTEFIAQQSDQVKKLSHHLTDRDASTAQSSSHSHQELSGSSEGNTNQLPSETDSKCKGLDEVHTNSVPLGSSEVAFAPPKLDYSQSFVCVPYPYTDPYFAALFAPYGSNAVIHPQIAEMVSAARVPLPLEPAADEPIYVNAKQYAAILRRRQLRAKLEAQNKLIKTRKPYLHESRHLHAIKRARGSAGRFLNKKQLQQQEQQQQADSLNASGASGSMALKQEEFKFTVPDFHLCNGAILDGQSSNAHPCSGAGMDGGSGTVGNASGYRFPASG